METLKENIIPHEKAIMYLFAGNSLTTIVNENSGNRLTYKIKKHKTKDIFFISCSYAYEQYKYICLAEKVNGMYLLRFTNGSKVSEDSQCYKVINYVIHFLQNGEIPNFIKIYHHNICVKCGRTLTVPSSILQGMGDYCAKKVLENKK